MPREKQDQVSIELTEEQRRQAEQSRGEEDVTLQGEELEERIAPAQAPVLDTGVL